MDLIPKPKTVGKFLVNLTSSTRREFLYSKNYLHKAFENPIEVYIRVDPFPQTAKNH